MSGHISRVGVLKVPGDLIDGVFLQNKVSDLSGVEDGRLTHNEQILEDGVQLKFRIFYRFMPLSAFQTKAGCSCNNAHAICPARPAPHTLEQVFLEEWLNPK